MAFIHSLRFKVVFILCFTFVASLLVYMFLLLPVMQSRGIENALENQRVLADEMANHIDFHFQQAKNELEAIARLPAIVSMDKTELDRILHEMDAVTRFFNYFFVLDKNGQWISYPQRPSLVGDRIPEENMHWVIKTLSTRQTVYLNVVRSKVNTLVSGFSTPVMDVDGNILGLIRGVMVVSKENTASDIITRNRIGKNGFVYLVAADGTLLAHSDMDIRFEKYEEYNYSSMPPVARLMEGKPGGMEYRYKGEDWVVVYRPIETTGWGVVVQQPRADVIEQVTENTNWTTRRSSLSRRACSTFFCSVMSIETKRAATGFCSSSSIG